MRIIHTIEEMRATRRVLQSEKKHIGFVPTMGALHAGHISLLENAKRQCSVVVMSIFVNPTQFGPNEDFSRYPRPLEADCSKALAAGCDILFLPTEKEIYPDSFSTSIAISGVTETLEGAIRPDHFRGVATVVLKLLNIVQPDSAFFGQKDAQQVVVIRKMARDLNLACSISVVHTVREHDGLALSSRNIYLTHDERLAAPLIYKGLSYIETLYKNGERQTKAFADSLAAMYATTALFVPDYIAVVDLESLAPVMTVEKATLICVACRTTQSKTRLLDNIVLHGSW